MATRYVPAIAPAFVVEFINTLLDGNDPDLLNGPGQIDSSHYEDAGTLPTISHLRALIIRLEDIPLRDKEQANYLRDAKRDLQNVIDHRDFLHRLINNERMEEAYRILGAHISIEPQPLSDPRSCRLICNSREIRTWSGSKWNPFAQQLLGMGNKRFEPQRDPVSTATPRRTAAHCR